MKYIWIGAKRIVYLFMKFNHATKEVTIALSDLMLLLIMASNMEMDIVDYYGKDEGAEMEENYNRIKDFYYSIKHIK